MSLINVKASTWNAEDTLLVNIINDLKSVVKLSGIILVKGHSNVKDGGGGEFTFDETVLRSLDNGGTIIAPTISDGLSSGCWVRRYNNQEYSLAFFGSNDTSKVNLLAAYGVEGAVVSIIEDGYLTTYEFDLSLVGSHDGSTNYNGWIKQAVLGTGSLVWKNTYVGGTYLKDEVVRDGDWTMVANQDTTERPAPQPVGASYYGYVDGNESSANTTAKQVIYGSRIVASTRGFFNGYRLKVVSGQSYSVFSVENPLVTPVIKEINSFEANTTGWVFFNITPVLITDASTFDLCVRVSVPDASPTVSATQYNYSTPAASTTPLVGGMTHATDEPGIIKVNNQGSDTTDNSTIWNAISVGDIIKGAGGEWVIQYKVNQTTYWDLHVSPASVGSPALLTTFNVETVAAAVTVYDAEVDHWLADSSKDGLFIQDGGYNTIVSDDNAYMIDIKLQDASISEHWEVLAVSESASANDAGGFIPHTLDSHTDTNMISPANGSVVTWDNISSKWIASEIDVASNGMNQTNFSYQWNTPIDASPLSGRTSTNNVTPSSATIIYVNELDVGAFSKTLQLAVVKDGDWIDLSKVGEETTVYANYTVNGVPTLNGSIWQIPVVSRSDLGSLILDDFVNITWRDITAQYSTADLDSIVSDINHVTIELPNVDNTSDLNKPISTATQTALDDIEALALAGL